MAEGGRLRTPLCCATSMTATRRATSSRRPCCGPAERWTSWTCLTRGPTFSPWPATWSPTSGGRRSDGRDGQRRRARGRCHLDQHRRRHRGCCSSPQRSAGGRRHPQLRDQPEHSTVNIGNAVNAVNQARRRRAAGRHRGDRAGRRRPHRYCRRRLVRRPGHRVPRHRTGRTSGQRVHRTAAHRAPCTQQHRHDLNRDGVVDAKDLKALGVASNIETVKFRLNGS